MSEHNAEIMQLLTGYHIWGSHPHPLHGRANPDSMSSGDLAPAPHQLLYLGELSPLLVCFARAWVQ